MNTSPQDPWSLLAASACRVQPAESRSDEAPFGFATRIVSCWQDLQRSERFRFWGAWSFRAALAAVVLCAVSAIWQPTAEAAPEPWADLPTLALPLP